MKEFDSPALDREHEQAVVVARSFGSVGESIGRFEDELERISPSVRTLAESEKTPAQRAIEALRTDFDYLVRRTIEHQPHMAAVIVPELASSPNERSRLTAAYLVGELYEADPTGCRPTFEKLLSPDQTPDIRLETAGEIDSLLLDGRIPEDFLHTLPFDEVEIDPDEPNEPPRFVVHHPDFPDV